MTICLLKLAVTGPSKKAAELIFEGKSHLIFGPTDTGKSYIVECLRYCLGSGTRPKDIGFSEGYTRVLLQVQIENNDKFTIFRNLSDDSELIFSGLHSQPPQAGPVSLDCSISDFLIAHANAQSKRILTKAGTLGNLTANDLRRVSIFDEIETLNNVTFQGSNVTFQTRNKASLALILTGMDDSEIALATSTNDRNIAKGRVEATIEQIQKLHAEIPIGVTKDYCDAALSIVIEKINSINNFLKDNSSAILILNSAIAEIEKDRHSMQQKIKALSEAKSRFILLDEKYISDFERLQAMGTAAAVLSTFETRPCPLCLTDLQHQELHGEAVHHTDLLRNAALIESEKISSLRIGLNAALDDVNKELEEMNHELSLISEKHAKNVRVKFDLLNQSAPNSKEGLVALTEQRTSLTIAINNFESIEKLQIQLEEMKKKTKRRKQATNRDISHSSSVLCKRIKELLADWNVPGVDAVFFDEVEADIEINQRKRVSFGKGKRGIFLSAYMIALMERALENGFPHLGLTVIDSPVVTYKDPKHAATGDSEELLSLDVKDRFYSWLANRRGKGQVIILENEEPLNDMLPLLETTEFMGASSEVGRRGFFPV